MHTYNTYIRGSPLHCVPAAASPASASRDVRVVDVDTCIPTYIHTYIHTYIFVFVFDSPPTPRIARRPLLVSEA